MRVYPSPLKGEGQGVRSLPAFRSLTFVRTAAGRRLRSTSQKFIQMKFISSVDCKNLCFVFACRRRKPRIPKHKLPESIPNFPFSSLSKTKLKSQNKITIHILFFLFFYFPASRPQINSVKKLCVMKR